MTFKASFVDGNSYSTSISPWTECSFGEEIVSEPILKTSNSVDKKTIDHDFDEFELIEEFEKV